MCGIVAILARETPIDESALRAATERLRHRGPDGRRRWIAPDGRVGLGHARLSIIDLETGDQPLANEDESVFAVVNGEFYDYERIQRQLEWRGHRLRSRSDSEILLHLYEEFGADCLRHLRGEFAFALWDERQQTLFAARDRFGVKPLFYARHGDALHLASEIKALLAAGVPARWDSESLYQQLFLYQNPDRTLFDGVRQIPSGCYLLATRRHQQIMRYWDLDYPREEQRVNGKLSDEERVERLREALAEAVRLRLRADVPVGCFLSGGLDSSAVLGFAAQAQSEPPRSYTVAFDHADYDERTVARETASHVQSAFRCVAVSQDDIADHLAATIAQGETVGVNWHAAARYLLCRAMHDDGYKVALSGEGGDELFAGYLQMRQDHMLHSPSPFQAGAEARLSTGEGAHQPSSHNLPAPLAVVQRTLGFVPAWLNKLAVGRAIFHVLLARDYAAEFAGHNPFQTFLNQFDLEGQLAGRDPLRQSQYLWTRSILPNYTLFAERLEMAHAVEVRVPLLDHHVFEVARELPASLLIRGAQEKHVLREAARPVLTETVYRRAKHPFLAPPVTLTANNRLHALAQDTLRGESLAAAPFFDRAAVIDLLDKLPALDESRRMALDATLLMLLCVCCLQQSYRLSL
jgi:asparagine synthase (glutamine-hydrolysing)